MPAVLLPPGLPKPRRTVPSAFHNTPTPDPPSDRVIRPAGKTEKIIKYLKNVFVFECFLILIKFFSLISPE